MQKTKIRKLNFIHAIICNTGYWYRVF